MREFNVLLYLSDRYFLGMAVWLVAGAVAFWLLLRCRSMWRRQPRRLAWTHAGLSLWMCLAALTAVELYFALIYDSSDSFNMTNVSKKWFMVHAVPQQRLLTLAEHEQVLYRDDRLFPTQLGRDQRHIVFLGDSFTFGQGVPRVADRFSNRIRAELEPPSKNRVIVSNLAECGIELHVHKRMLELLFANRQRVDVAVYVMCLNDIETFHDRHRTYYEGFGGPTPETFLIRDTYFFNWVYFRLWKSRVPDVQNYYSFVKDYYDGEPWRRMRLLLDDVHELCLAHQTEFRVVVFPFLHNLGPDYPFHEAHKQIVEYCRVAKIPVLDLEPILAPHVSKGLTVNRFDAHPNELAHGLAARAILQNLLRDFLTNGNPGTEG